ncbi:(2Fe-2S)-binding protein [Acinetobacter sp. B5B]|uniref:2Fe-2S iron-sulfur cluster-binding protein n=1 Tax=Acinetobacter baretiae TaxID=2605383 RepID=UPI0018C2B67F|nr:2Fe-2S iron-sulfur cluster-binding protein [Acinetobacter baretiae]MBF7682623.1 (2Fe-2S)-binding protein [Acinetobacter baretiae]MBF7685601.1 (2Fe-2S)-binding protein [Acinetobacter baretiae]
MAHVRLYINDHLTVVEYGTSVAAALLNTTHGICRHSVSAEPRSPFCGMGVCHECRVVINGVRQLACQTLCEANMHITVES